MKRRVNITLPEETLRLIDRIAKRGNRSRLIDKAVRYYIDQLGRENLRERLEQGALVRAGRDLHLSEEWFDLDEEAWQDAG